MIISLRQKMHLYPLPLCSLNSDSNMPTGLACCYLTILERPSILSSICADFWSQQKNYFYSQLDTHWLRADYIAPFEIWSGTFLQGQ